MMGDPSDEKQTRPAATEVAWRQNIQETEDFSRLGRKLNGRKAILDRLRLWNVKRMPENFSGIQYTLRFDVFNRIETIKRRLKNNLESAVGSVVHIRQYRSDVSARQPISRC